MAMVMDREMETGKVTGFPWQVFTKTASGARGHGGRGGRVAVGSAGEGAAPVPTLLSTGSTWGLSLARGCEQQVRAGADSGCWNSQGPVCACLLQC